LLSFTSYLNVETFVAFFLVSCSLKLLEFQRKNDGSLILTLSFVSIAAGFLFYQNVISAVFSLLCCVVIFQAWMTLHRTRNSDIFRELRTALILVLVVLPVTVVLFIVMPRAGQLWYMPSQSKVGTTGFSNTMSPGSFSQLIQSDNVAFRVSFASERIPTPEQRYWRGLVLNSFDGQRWSRIGSFGFRGQSRAAGRAPEEWLVRSISTQEPLRYSVLIEPHLNRSLFTLMAPVDVRSSTLSLVYGPDATLFSRTPVAARAKYTVESNVSYSYSPDEIQARIRRINTQLPQRGNQATRTWALQLREKHGVGVDADRRIASEVLQYFNRDFISATTVDEREFGRCVFI
jgi:hypothetical protein